MAACCCAIANSTRCRRHPLLPAGPICSHAVVTAMLPIAPSKLQAQHPFLLSNVDLSCWTCRAHAAYACPWVASPALPTTTKLTSGRPPGAPLWRHGMLRGLFLTFLSSPADASPIIHTCMASTMGHANREGYLASRAFALCLQGGMHSIE